MIFAIFATKFCRWSRVATVRWNAADRRRGCVGGPTTIGGPRGELQPQESNLLIAPALGKRVAEVASKRRGQDERHFKPRRHHGCAASRLASAASTHRPSGCLRR